MSVPDFEDDEGQRVSKRWSFDKRITLSTIAGMIFLGIGLWTAISADRVTIINRIDKQNADFQQKIDVQNAAFAKSLAEQNTSFSRELQDANIHIANDDVKLTALQEQLKAYASQQDRDRADEATFRAEMRASIGDLIKSMAEVGKDVARVLPRPR